MSTTNASEFEQLEAALDQGVPAVIERLIVQLREKKKYHHLFEALKLRLRHRMGLPLWEHTPGEQLDPQLRDRYEDGLVEACREVGLLLPCNVVVRAGEGGTIVEAMDPEAAMGMVQNPAVAEVAREAKALLVQALNSLTES